MAQTLYFSWRRKINKPAITEKPEFINFCTARVVQKLRDFLVGINWQQHPYIEDCSLYFENECRGEHIEFSIVSKYQMMHPELQTEEEKTQVQKHLKYMKSSSFIGFFDDLAVDVFDIACHLFITRADKAKDYIEVTADDFLFIRGLGKKNNSNGGKSGYQNAQRKDIENRLGAISLIQCYWAYRYNEKCKGTIFSAKKTSKSFHYKIFMGDLLRNFTNKRNVQFGQYPQSILNLNCKKDFFPKRIGRYIYWRARISKGEIPYTRIINYISAVNPSYCKNIKRCRLSMLMDNAFFKLQELNIIQNYAFQHAESYKDDEDTYCIDEQTNLYYTAIFKKNEGLKNYLNKTLVKIEPLNEISNPYKKIETKNEKYIPSKKEKIQTFKQHVIRRLKTVSSEKNYSTKYLASKMNISRKTLGLYLNEKQLPSKSNAHSIFKFLESIGAQNSIVWIELE